MKPMGTMENWQQRVREHLEACKLPREIRDEVVNELAAHLEEMDEEARARGLSETAAVEVALQEVKDWRVLAEDICRAKAEEEQMNHRTKSLWLPALMNLAGASLALMLMQLLGMRPGVIWMGKLAITCYWAWLASLPLFGAAGAYLSQRARGAARARLAAGLSPALVMLIVMSLILPWGLAIDGVDFIRLVGFGLALVTWVVIPGVALLVGALPFLWSGRWLGDQESIRG